MAEARVNDALSKVFLFTLDAGSATPTVVYLASVDQEIRGEQGSQEQPLLSKATLERALFSRLSETPAAVISEAPFRYLVGCHRRASDEKRRLPVREDEKKPVEEALTFGEELAISYSGMLLNLNLDGMFPQPEAARARGPLQLLDVLEPQQQGGPALATPDYLASLVARYESEGLEDIVGPAIEGLNKKVANMSPLAPFQTYFDLLQAFAAMPATAKLMARLPTWHCPPKRNGRAAMNMSLMGPFLNISVFPDQRDPDLPPVVGLPPVSDVLNPGMKRNEVDSGMQLLRGYAQQLQKKLHDVLKALLVVEKGAVREEVLAWIGDFINANAGRGRMQIDVASCATHGACVNLSAVLLRLCAPFLEPTGAKWAGKIDPMYVVRGRLDYSEDTRLVATSGEVTSWALSRTSSQLSASSPLPSPEPPSSSSSLTASLSSPLSGAGGSADSFHFICECFFLTARAMHIGVLKCTAELKETAEEMQRYQQQVVMLERSRPSWAGSPMAAATEGQLREFQQLIQSLQHDNLVIQTALAEPRLVADSIAFYRVMAAWLTRLACSGGAEFQALPEYFVEDLADFLLFVSRLVPQLLAGERLDEFMDFLVVFIGSPTYVKNPYLRAKFVEVLRHWMPNTDPEGGRDTAVQMYTRGLFEAHALSERHLTHALLSLYVDVEFTGANTQFYDKMNIRYSLGNLLEYLWSVPGHRAVWCALARRGDTFYLRFTNMIVNDAIYQLDEALKKIPEARELEEQSAAGAWAALPPRERRQREKELEQMIGICRTNLLMALQHMRILQATTTEAACARVLMSSEMVNRTADMLNYFLKFLAGAERRRLRVKDPEKYGWDPKELLKTICSIYVHLSDVDGQSAFAKAVAADGRSYKDECFSEAAHVLRTFSLLSEADAGRLEMFAERARAFHTAAAQEEEEMGEVPDEFLDELMSTVMEDPVKLPSGQTLDRSTIMRHLLSDSSNPFTRGPLTADQLIPQPELKARIDEFRRSKRGGGGATPMDI